MSITPYQQQIIQAISKMPSATARAIAIAVNKPDFVNAINRQLHFLAEKGLVKRSHTMSKCHITKRYNKTHSLTGQGQSLVQKSPLSDEDKIKLLEMINAAHVQAMDAIQELLNAMKKMQETK